MRIVGSYRVCRMNDCSSVPDLGDAKMVMDSLARGPENPVRTQADMTLVTLRRSIYHVCNFITNSVV